MMFSTYDQDSGHYLYYQSYRPAYLRVNDLDIRKQFKGYHKVQVLMPNDVRPVATGVVPKGMIVDRDIIPCIHPCMHKESNTIAWVSLLVLLRMMLV